MAQFIAKNPSVKGNIQLLTPYFNADTRGKAKRLEIFEKYGIDLNKEVIYPIQTILDYFKDLAETLGEMNLFLIGKSCTKDLNFSNISNFKEAVEAINILYHRTYTLDGETLYDEVNKVCKDGIGNYVVTKFDEVGKEMIIVSSTPYTSKSDEGMLQGLLEKYKPKHIKSFSIKLDINKERRDLGGDSCTFITNWT